MQMLITVISLVLDMHDHTSCMSDVALHHNDIAVIVNESVASEVHNTGVNDNVYVVEDTPCVPEHNYRRLLMLPGDVSTPQLSREDPNPIPTNLLSLSQFARKCFPYFFIGVSAIYHLFSHATYLKPSVCSS